MVTGDEGCQKPTPSDQHEKALSDEESVWGSLGIQPAQMSNAENIFFSSEAMQCWVVAQTLPPWLCSGADMSEGSWRNCVGLGEEHMRCCAQTATAAFHPLWGKDSEALCAQWDEQHISSRFSRSFLG